MQFKAVGSKSCLCEALCHCVRAVQIHPIVIWEAIVGVCAILDCI